MILCTLGKANQGFDVQATANHVSYVAIYTKSYSVSVQSTMEWVLATMCGSLSTVRPNCPDFMSVRQTSWSLTYTNFDNLVNQSPATNSWVVCANIAVGVGSL